MLAWRTKRQLRAIARRIVGRHASIQFVGTIPVPLNDAHGWGSAGANVATAAGAYFPASRSIKIAMRDPLYQTPHRAVLHECFHAAEHLLLTQDELADLEQHTPDFLDIVKGYADLSWAEVYGLSDLELRATAFEAAPFHNAVFVAVFCGEVARRTPKQGGGTNDDRDQHRRN